MIFPSSGLLNDAAEDEEYCSCRRAVASTATTNSRPGSVERMHGAQPRSILTRPPTSNQMDRWSLGLVGSKPNKCDMVLTV